MKVLLKILMACQSIGRPRPSPFQTSCPQHSNEFRGTPDVEGGALCRLADRGETDYGRLIPAL